jgi:hypothetical protein
VSAHVALVDPQLGSNVAWPQALGCQRHDAIEGAVVLVPAGN